jgi:hypothetical protein
MRAISYYIKTIMFAVNGRNIFFSIFFFYILGLLFPRYFLVLGDLITIVPFVLGFL